MTHVLRQARRLESFVPVAAHGQQVHAGWCALVFAPYQHPHGVHSRRPEAQLVAVCDFSAWHLLHRQQGVSLHQTHLALLELLERTLP